LNALKLEAKSTFVLVVAGLLHDTGAKLVVSTAEFRYQNGENRTQPVNLGSLQFS
jgi:ABC-type antimicrobial peptide transport system ATPase subunit